MLKIPNNMTEAETMSIIDKVCSSVSNNFSFGHFDSDDIYQESFIICAEIIDKYDGTRPLENFLNVSLRNRLRNFKRDNSQYYKYQCEVCGNQDIENCENCLRHRVVHQTKKNIEHPINIDDVSESVVYEGDDIKQYMKKEIFGLINKHLPLHMRTDYLKIMSDVYVNKNRRDEIINRIKDILTQHDCMDE